MEFLALNDMRPVRLGDQRAPNADHIDMNWTVEAGKFTISTGNSSANLQTAELTVRA